MDPSRLTRELLSSSRVIARGAGIRALPRLLKRYGGRPRGWVKKSTHPLADGAGRWYEYHWYEHHGLGRVEIKQVFPDRR